MLKYRFNNKIYKNMENQSEEKNYKKWLLYSGIFIALAAIALIVYLLYSGDEKPAPQALESGEQPAGENIVNKTAEEKAVLQNKLKENTIDENALKKMAASFAERLGSFSNQSNYGNISDLKIFMTDRMRTWADDYVSGQREKENGSAAYYGITAKALSEETASYDEAGGKAEIVVKTQKREVSGNSEPSVYYQDIKIIFIKEKGAWKVDSADWANNK